MELVSYANSQNEKQDLNKEQFEINETRSLGEIIGELLDKDYIPSFCTACYRLGRTGEHFMEFSVPGFIKRFCTPNALLTLTEYLIDYASDEVKEKGWKQIDKEIAKIEDPKLAESIKEKIEKIKQGERDLYY